MRDLIARVLDRAYGPALVLLLSRALPATGRHRKPPVCTRHEHTAQRRRRRVPLSATTGPDPDTRDIRPRGPHPGYVYTPHTLRPGWKVTFGSTR
ncbi:hypothetical protein GCM10010405_39920 [Streptomyces macrosporus]|uniref:Secreted protein n=1 Tax=Streptomyces macrosporus TaxID=44032 RepID=A0ABN3K7Z5_9ACTN